MGTGVVIVSKALDRLFADLPSRLSVEQLTDILGLSEKTVTYRWLREGRVPAIRLGGTWIIFRDDVREHLEAHYNTPKPSSETTELDPPENPEGT